MEQTKKEKRKKILFIMIPIILLIILILFSLFRFEKQTVSYTVSEEYAREISEDTIFKLLEVFNTQNYYEVKEIYLPYQKAEEQTETPEEIVAIKEKFYLDFAQYAPFILEGVGEIKQDNSGTISGEVFFKDNSRVVNYIDEYEKGWKNFGVQNCADFEIVKENGKMKVTKFVVKETYTYQNVTEEFLDRLYSATPDGEFAFVTRN